jgi:uncharacterized protein (TIGR02594 family)
MKSDKRSVNVEDRSRDTSVYAPHRNPTSNLSVMQSRNAEVKAMTESDLQRIKTLGKTNPMAHELRGMDIEYNRAMNNPASDKGWTPVPTSRPTSLMSDVTTGKPMTSPMALAASMLGKSEGPDHAALTEYLKNGGANLDPATTAWCAAFVNSTLGQAGLKGTGSNLAKSFLNYGQATDKPQKGDIAVFSRGDPNGPYGHVGFFDSVNPDGTIRVLAGNQGNAVSYGNQPAANLLGYRHPIGSPNTADGPKGQESYPAGGAAPQPILGPQQTAQPPILGDPSIPQDVANYWKSLPDDGSQPKSPLQNMFAALAKTPNAEPVRFGPMGDARQTGDSLLKQLNAPTLADLLAKKRMLG